MCQSYGRLHTYSTINQTRNLCSWHSRGCSVFFASRFSQGWIPRWASSVHKWPTHIYLAHFKFLIRVILNNHPLAAHGLEFNVGMVDLHWERGSLLWKCRSTRESNSRFQMEFRHSNFGELSTWCLRGLNADLLWSLRFWLTVCFHSQIVDWVSGAYHI